MAESADASDELFAASLSGCRGVLNAPVDCCCSFSKISCSSFGRRGGDGPGDHDDRVAIEVEKGRLRKPGRIVRTILLVDCMFGSSLRRKEEVRRRWCL